MANDKDNKTNERKIGPVVTIIVQQLPGDTPLYRVGMVGSDGKVSLTRRFRERHIAIGMAVSVGMDLGVDPDLTIRAADDTGSDE